jgi:hypothetical protein
MKFKNHEPLKYKHNVQLLILKFYYSTWHSELLIFYLILFLITTD